MTLALAIPEISLGPQKFTMDYGTVTTTPYDDSFAVWWVLI